VLGRWLWIVGDTVFPGRRTMATVISAIRVIERITGVAWANPRTSRPEIASAADRSAVAPARS
jgi:hypothetical protein